MEKARRARSPKSTLPSSQNQKADKVHPRPTSPAPPEVESYPSPVPPEVESYPSPATSNQGIPGAVSAPTDPHPKKRQRKKKIKADVAPNTTNGPPTPDVLTPPQLQIGLPLKMKDYKPKIASTKTKQKRFQGAQSLASLGPKTVTTAEVLGTVEAAIAAAKARPKITPPSPEKVTPTEAPPKKAPTGKKPAFRPSTEIAGQLGRSLSRRKWQKPQCWYTVDDGQIQKRGLEMSYESWGDYVASGPKQSVQSNNLSGNTSLTRNLPFGFNLAAEKDAVYMSDNEERGSRAPNKLDAPLRVHTGSPISTIRGSSRTRSVTADDGIFTRPSSANTPMMHSVASDSPGGTSTPGFDFGSLLAVSETSKPAGISPWGSDAFLL